MKLAKQLFFITLPLLFVACGNEAQPVTELPYTPPKKREVVKPVILNGIADTTLLESGEKAVKIVAQLFNGGPDTLVGLRVELYQADTLYIDTLKIQMANGDTIQGELIFEEAIYGNTAPAYNTSVFAIEK